MSLSVHLIGLLQHMPFDSLEYFRKLVLENQSYIVKTYRLLFFTQMAGISGGKLIQRFHCISKFDNLQSSGPFRKTLATLRMPSPVKSVSKSPAKNVQAKKFKLEDAEEAAPVLCFSKLSEAATAPTRGSKLAAGYDLYR